MSAAHLALPVVIPSCFIRQITDVAGDLMRRFTSPFFRMSAGWLTLAFVLPACSGGGASPGEHRCFGPDAW